MPTLTFGLTRAKSTQINPFAANRQISMVKNSHFIVRVEWENCCSNKHKTGMNSQLIRRPALHFGYMAFFPRARARQSNENENIESNSVNTHRRTDVDKNIPNDSEIRSIRAHVHSNDDALALWRNCVSLMHTHTHARWLLLLNRTILTKLSFSRTYRPILSIYEHIESAALTYCCHSTASKSAASVNFVSVTHNLLRNMRKRREQKKKSRQRKQSNSTHTHRKLSHLL